MIVEEEYMQLVDKIKNSIEEVNADHDENVN